MIIFIASFIGAFLFFLLFFIGLRAVVKQRREVADRIQLFTGYQPTEVQETSFLQVLKGKIHQIFEGLEDRAQDEPEPLGSHDDPGRAALTGIRIPCHFRYGGAGDIPIGSPSYPESGDRPHCGCPFPGG